MITDEMIAYESGESVADHRWSRWVEAAEKLLGHDLDGDQETDGYSLDEAYDLHSQPRPAGHARITPEQYVAIVALRKNSEGRQ